MEQGRKFLKVAAIANIMYGLLMSNITIFSIGLVVLGFILYSLSFQDDILENKVFLIAIAIGTILFNIVSGVFLFMSINELEKERNYKNTQDSGGVVKQDINPENKKIDLLLKLGVGMVFVSGILFATTSWTVITDIIKLITLLVLGTAFLGLSIFTEKKLNIKKTSIMYWFLSMSFYFAIIVGIGYFGLLGPTLSYQGEYKDIMYGITIFFLSIITAVSYLKYEHNSLLYLTYLFLFLGTYYMLLGLKLPEEVIYLILSSISLLINITTDKETSINRFNTILSYYFAVKTIYLCGSDSKTIVSILTLLNMANITYLSKRTNNVTLSLLTIICDYVFIYISIFIHNFDLSTIIVMLLTTILSILIKYNILFKFKETNILNDIVYLISTLILFCVSFELTAIEVVIVSTIYLIYILISMYLKDDIIDKYILSVAIFLEVLALGYLANNISSDFEVGYNYVFLILTLIYTVIYALINGKEKQIFFIATLLSTLLTTFINLFNQNTLVQLITLIPLTYLFIKNINVTEQGINKLLYIALLVDISVAAILFNLTGIKIANALIVLLIYVLLLYAFHNSESLTKINNFAIIVPLLYSIDCMEYKFIYKKILISILEFYTLYLLLKFICHSKSDKELLSIFGTIFIIFQIFFTNEWIVGIYIGAIGIILIFIGFYIKEYEKLFILGILVTIANIIYQLRQLWSQIPFYLYLLIGGLGIISFVTYKELKNNKK